MYVSVFFVQKKLIALNQKKHDLMKEEYARVTLLDGLVFA